MVFEHRRPPAVEPIERLEGHTAPRFYGFRRGFLDAVDPDVGVPVGGHALGRSRSDPGHVATAELAHEVLPGRVGRRTVFDLPPEQLRVEADRAIGVQLKRVDPAGDASLVPVVFAQLSSFVADRSVRHARPWRRIAPRRARNDVGEPTPAGGCIPHGTEAMQSSQTSENTPSTYFGE